MDEPPQPPERFDLVLGNSCRDPEVRLRELRPWLHRVVAELSPEAASLGVQLTSDRGIQRLNREFRGVDAATDVLSFPGGDSPAGRHLGDIAVSVPTARRQAGEAGHSLRRELELLLLHGLLHCLGYDHEADDGTMERLESRLRRRWVSDDG